MGAAGQHQAGAGEQCAEIFFHVNTLWRKVIEPI
jgi:hypothetical protein